MNGLFSTTSDFLLLVLGFSFIIFIHELGHFLAARWAGIRVEQFAIGFGQPLVAWRRGWGFSFGKPTPAPGVGHSGVSAATDVGETEYRINWIPLGGYVRMLGQDDLDMSSSSADPSSYSAKSVGARMVVVSAGVVMNVILAVIFFIICYTVGVVENPPVVGFVSPTSDAAHVLPAEARDLGILQPGLLPGDEITQVNGRAVSKFSQILLQTALSRPQQPVSMRVLRNAESLNFTFEVDADRDSKLLDLGISPAASTRLLPLQPGDTKSQDQFEILLRRIGIDPALVSPGMRLQSANGQTAGTDWELDRIVDASDGAPLALVFVRVDENSEPIAGSAVSVSVTPSPNLFQGRVRTELATVAVTHMLGLAPAVRAGEVVPDSPADLAGVQDNDVFMAVGDLVWPRADELMGAMHALRGKTVKLTLLRDGKRVTVEAKVGRDGRLGVMLADSDAPVIAGPFAHDGSSRSAGTGAARSADAVDSREDGTPLSPWAGATLGLIPGTVILECAGSPVSTWQELQLAVRMALSNALAPSQVGENSSAAAAIAPAPPDPSAQVPLSLSLKVRWPTPGSPVEEISWSIPRSQAIAFVNLGWNVAPLPALFAPLERTQRADSWIEAAQLGLQETLEMVETTYLTLDRLFRGSIKTEHLKGPVGIAEIGTQVADRGFTALLQFLGVISINLAVLNFLPIPIVDGGLFLFLIIEKIKGSPVSARVQEFATMIGLFILGTLFVMTFYNDIMNLFSGK